MADGAETFFGQIADRETRAATNYFAMRNADGDRAARANRLAAETGLPADMVERNIDEVAGRQRAERGKALLQSSPSLSAWFSNPRNAAAGADDIDTLHAIDATFGKVTRNAPVRFTDRAALLRGLSQDRARGIEDARPKSTPGSWWPEPRLARWRASGSRGSAPSNI
jgi:hypothetical protein